MGTIYFRFVNGQLKNAYWLCGDVLEEIEIEVR